MKKAVFFCLMVMWIGTGGTFTHTVSASNSYRDITLTTAGTLIDSLATGDTQMDSIVIRGPIDDFDFPALRYLAQINESLVINLAYADVVNKTIPENALSEFAIRKNIKRIILPDDIHTIGACAFQHLTNLTDVNLPAGLRQLGQQAFYGCTSLAPDTLRIPEGVEIIPRFCFGACSKLKHIILPKSLKHIKNVAFQQDFQVQSITFQEGLESIGYEAFHGMTGIDTIRLPQSVTKIDEAAFAYNFSLRYINIPAGVTTIPVEFASQSNLDSIYIPDNVITIEEKAFSGTSCAYLRLSKNITTIKSGAFGRNELTDILLPASLQFIGAGAFSSETVKRIYCPANIPPTLESTDKAQWAFAGCAENTTLFVPVGCGDTYRNTPGWNNIPNIEEIAEFPSSINEISRSASWTAKAGKGIIFLQNNDATAVRLSIHFLGGELIDKITLQSRSSIEITPGSYLISDGKNGKTIIVK